MAIGQVLFVDTWQPRLCLFVLKISIFTSPGVNAKPEMGIYFKKLLGKLLDPP